MNITTKITFRPKNTVRVEMCFDNKTHVVYGPIKNTGRLVGGIAHHFVVEENKKQLSKSEKLNP